MVEGSFEFPDFPDSLGFFEVFEEDGKLGFSSE